MHRVYVIDMGRKFLYLQWVDHQTGKKKTVSSKTTKRREAERKAKELEDRLNEHLAPADGSIGWDAFVSRYHIQHLHSLAHSSEKKALGVLDSFQKYCKCHRLSDITPSTLSWYAGQLRNSSLSESTIAGHIRTLRASFSWAVQTGLLPKVPKMPRITRSKNKKARGRPISAAEFAKMLRASREVVGVSQSRSWRYLMRGLWLSGLRIGEAISLRWTPGPWPWIDAAGPTWWLVIPAESDKGHQERRLPVVPEWKSHLQRISEDRRDGFVYNPQGERAARVRFFRVTQVIGQIGSTAGVIVDHSTKKTATAHDFRRAFAQRWAAKLSPIDLQRMMRHADISTTMEYYLDSDSDGLASRVGA